MTKPFGSRNFFLEPSLDSLSLRSDVTRSLKIHSHLALWSLDIHKQWVCKYFQISSDSCCVLRASLGYRCVYMTAVLVQGYLAHKRMPPPWDHHRALGPLGPLGFECSQHRQTLRPTVDGTRSKTLRPFRLQ